jgi:phosphotriesterase-related protein
MPTVDAFVAGVVFALGLGLGGMTQPARIIGFLDVTGRWDGTLALVMGAGWYRTAYYPFEARIDRRSADDLADELVAEFERGVGETGVRPGILGEIGVDKPWLTAQEERVFRAVARAARRTGMAVSTHAVMSPVGLEQLKVLEEEGLDPARVVIGHSDSYPRLDHYLEICRRGANLEFDFLGMAFTPLERHDEPVVVRRLLELLDAGHADRILLSQDVCHDSQLTAYDGNGYTYLQRVFLPRLRAAGVDEATLRRLTVDNPLRILAIGG